MSVMISEIRPNRLVQGQVAVRSRSGTLRFVRFGIWAVLIVAPLGFGATTTAGSLLLVAAAWLLMVLWLSDGLKNGEWQLNTLHVLAPAALLLGFTTVHWAAGISVNPAGTQLEWLRWVGYLALAIVAAESFGTPRRLLRLARVLAVAGFVIAVLGLAQYLTGNGKIYWVIEPSQGGWVFGPYVNRNHFAGLMELWLPVALGLALIPGNTFGKRWGWCALALVMASAVALSGSRGGMLAVAVEVLVMALAASALRGGQRALTGLLVAMLLVGGTVYALDRGEILERYKQSFRPHSLHQEEAAQYRVEAWRGSLELFRRNWAIGSGLDTFVTLFPGVRSFSTDKVWTHAHNDYLQFAAETGVVGILLAGWMLFAGGREAWRNLMRTNGTPTGAILIGLACGCFGFMVHGWLDFNGHIPANAANFSVLAAVLTRRGWDED